MFTTCVEKTLLEKLNGIPELPASGFVARAGLTGNGVTLLKGRSYFGAWRKTNNAFVWSYASSEDPYHAASLDDAILHTMKMILRALETSKVVRSVAARPELANRTA